MSSSFSGCNQQSGVKEGFYSFYVPEKIQFTSLIFFTPLWYPDPPPLAAVVIMSYFPTPLPAFCIHKLREVFLQQNSAYLVLDGFLLSSVLSVFDKDLGKRVIVVFFLTPPHFIMSSLVIFWTTTTPFSVRTSLMDDSLSVQLGTYYILRKLYCVGLV